MVFWTPPGHHQNVDIQQELCRSFSKGFQIFVSYSKGVVLLKGLAEDALEELSDRKDWEEKYSDGKCPK